MTPAATSARHPWTVIIPFKGSPSAKSRLSTAHSSYPEIGPELRLQLARAFVYDTVEATMTVADVTRVVVVSSDPVIQADLPEATLIADPGAGLNAAITAGIAEAVAIAADAPIAVLTGDLPGLQPQDLAAALQLAEQYPRTVVADHLGTGTTMITSMPGGQLVPRFGGPSHEQHRHGGHYSLEIPPTSTLRQDVDTPEDLHWALHCGVGSATSAVLRGSHGAPILDPLLSRLEKTA